MEEYKASLHDLEVNKKLQEKMASKTAVLNTGGGNMAQKDTVLSIL